MRFLGLGLADAVPDTNAVWTLREALKKADAVDVLFARFDKARCEVAGRTPLPVSTSNDTGHTSL